MNLRIIFILVIVSFYSCKLIEKNPKTEEVSGCTDKLAYNYFPDATQDDGSCDYCTGKSGSQFLLISYDGGVTWKRRCFNIPAGHITDISITDNNNIWVCTMGQSKAQILHSNNGGYTWHEQYEDTENNEKFIYIEMFDNSTGVAIGDGKDLFPLFLKTINGGLTWEKTLTQQIGLSERRWKTVDFVDVDNGYYFGSYPEYIDSTNTKFPTIIPGSQKLYKTTDSGYNWSEIIFDQYVGALSFFDTNIGLISGHNNKYYRTTDGSDTWQTTEVAIDDYSIYCAYDIAFHPSNPNELWIASGNGNLYKSNDMGSTLIEQSVSSERILAKDIYVGETTVWAVGQWPNFPLYVNRNLSQDNWDIKNLPLHDNKEIEELIDGVGDNIIVIPGHYF